MKHWLCLFMFVLFYGSCSSIQFISLQELFVVVTELKQECVL